MTSPNDEEIQEARLVLALAKEAGVEHVVFPSSLPLNNANVRADLEDSAAASSILNKADVEELVQASGMTWTLLRPGMFFSNFQPPLIHWIHPEIKEGKLLNSYGPDCLLPMVDPDDIGAFVAAAFQDPQKFGARIVTVVSEITRFDNIAAELRSATGSPIEAVHRTTEDTEKMKDNWLVAAQLLCIGMHKLVDMEEVRSWGVPLTTLKQFLEKHGHEISGTRGQ